MSDFNPFLGGGEPSPPEGDPEEGAITGDGQLTDQPAYEEPKEYLEVDQVADRYVRVKVDGEEQEVPLREALQGYSRTADYTRKTQELATQRQQADYALSLQRALQARPEETLWLLSRQYGVQVPGQASGQEQPAYDDGPEDDPYMDPLERRLNEQQRVIESMKQRDLEREADTRLRGAVGELQRRYQLDDATVREVVGTALQARLGPEAFDTIYKSIAFDRAQAQRANAMAARDQQRATGRAQAQQLIGSGSSANGAGGRMPVASDGPMSISQALNAALAEHGVPESGF